MREITKIIFEHSDELKKIFEHTKEAKEWSSPYGLFPEMVTEMHIDFVKDSGIYIMSGNKKTLPGENSTNMVAYARGFHPQNDEDYYDNAYDAVGGDDFCEPLPITGAMADLIIEGCSFIVSIDGSEWNYGAVR